MAKKRKNKRMRKRRWFTATERVEVWDRWQRGESSQSIGRVLERGGSAIHRQLAVYGGIRPQSRCRSSRALTLVEREEISRGIAAKESVRSIAVRLGRSPSTVSREVSRNGGSDSYRASEADERTWERARRRKSCRLARSPRLRQLVEEKLRQVWSPEQIAGWLKHSYPEDESLHVSHETIYRSLFVQARGVLKKELTQYLRTRRTIRRSGKASRKGHGKGQIEDMISIRERPASVEDRAVPGPRSLGRGSDRRIEAHLHRHSGRTSLALCDAGEGSQQEDRNCCQRAHRTGASTTDATLQITDLGSRSGNGGSQAVYPGDKHCRLFLRPTESMAARIE